MTAAAQSETLRFRGVWASGASFEVDDIAVTGQWTWRCIMAHVAGAQSQPGRGAHWTRFWCPTDGFGGARAGHPGGPMPAHPAPLPVAAPNGRVCSTARVMRGAFDERKQAGGGGDAETALGEV
jgi:hypothetical protein